jgi:NADH:ubiquinone oxidoreductase subunit K
LRGGATVQVGLNHYLVVSALLFCLGLYGVLTRRNAVAILMGIELMLNAANVNLVAFNRFVAPGGVAGQTFALVIITLAACEAAVGLALLMAAYRSLETIHVDEINVMKW